MVDGSLDAAEAPLTCWCANSTPKIMRRLQIGAPDRDHVTDGGVAEEDCGVALAVDGAVIMYYPIGAEITG